MVNFSKSPQIIEENYLVFKFNLNKFIFLVSLLSLHVDNYDYTKEAVTS